MVLHVKIDASEVSPDTYEKTGNLRAIYGDRMGLVKNELGFEIFLSNTNSEEIKRFGEYLHKIDKGLELYK